LTSKSKIKESAVKKWFRIYLKSELNLVLHSVDEKMIPEQPINTGGYLSCNDRIRHTEENYDLEEYDYILSIENSLKVENNMISDVVHIIIKNCKTSELFHSFGQDIDIDYKILETHPEFINIVNDLFQNYEETNTRYIYDGCELTLGKIINNYYSDIPDDNWMKYLFGKDRENQILKQLNTMSNEFQEDMYTKK